MAKHLGKTQEKESDAINVADLRLQYAGAIGLLCELSTQLRNSCERDDHLDSIEQAVSDWCKLTGWSYNRILHRIEVFPPVNS